MVDVDQVVLGTTQRRVKELEVTEVMEATRKFLIIVSEQEVVLVDTQ
jgi:hypothetical protein